MVTKKEIEKYASLPWSYLVEQEDGYFIVYVNELPGICTDGETIEEAMENIKEALRGAIELYLDLGKEIPEPISRSKYKGKIAYRTSPERHHLLARIARQKHQSLSRVIDRLVDTAVKNI